MSEISWWNMRLIYHYSKSEMLLWDIGGIRYGKYANFTMRGYICMYLIFANSFFKLMDIELQSPIVLTSILFMK